MTAARNQKKSVEASAGTVRKELADVKQPEDHKAPLGDFTLEFNDEEYLVHGRMFRDYNTVVLLAHADTNPGVVPTLLTKLLGEEHHKRLIESLTEEDGFCDADRVGEFLTAAVKASGRAKNS